MRGPSWQARLSLERASESRSVRPSGVWFQNSVLRMLEKNDQGVLTGDKESGHIYRQETKNTRMVPERVELFSGEAVFGPLFKIE